MDDKIKKYLNSIGLDFPSSESEVSSFNEIYEDFDTSIDEELLDPHKILKELKDEKIHLSKASNIDYHKRIVLAAEIVYELQNDKYLGHLKLQKLIFLCQNSFNMSLPVNFLQQAMGPYDPRLARSIDSQFLKRRWFEFKKDLFPKYHPLEKCGEHKEWVDRYFKDQKANIKSILNIFRRFNSTQIELVGTIYACWLKGLKENAIINNEYLIVKVYLWHPVKVKFTKEQITKAIEWMYDNGVYPKIK